jgi:CheY-like chemotaxis protein
MKLRKILIVDDDHQIAMGASVRLRAAGYETVFAHDGSQGIDAAHCEQPDAIVLDVRMPVMDGLACLAELKKHPMTKDIPVVMLSASVVDEEAALDAGARFFLRKPFAGKLLLEAIDAATSELNQLAT